MASSMGSLSRRLSLSLVSTIRSCRSSMKFCTNIISNENFDDDDSSRGQDGSSATSSTLSSPTNSDQEQKRFFQRPLENGLDVGVYKAILVGQVGQNPIQKRLRSGRPVTLFSLGTGGIRNNRRPFDSEEPREYANRCAVQWHRVAVYPERLGELVMKQVKPGSILYLEGNLETKIFSDQITGLVRRLREVAIRRDGRLVFLSNGGDDRQSTQEEGLRGVGYY
ncbi:hypothetical protein NE237_021507 [Protea cynaroides]|uniref:Single-stranded DNA-binding protein n=1 Tax=Protea cynaroides TaxID=273540 RepID=A0A9Q0H831_9MAGN|nr:hypothetical protein NE237_021507 [Protea cynaroides]